MKHFTVNQKISCIGWTVEEINLESVNFALVISSREIFSGVRIENYYPRGRLYSIHHTCIELLGAKRCSRDWEYKEILNPDHLGWNPGSPYEHGQISLMSYIRVKGKLL